MQETKYEALMKEPGFAELLEVEEQYLRDERAAIMEDSGIPDWIIQQVVEEEARDRVDR